MRLPLGSSLSRGFACVNSQLFVAGARFRGGAAARWQFDNAQDANLVAKREGDDAADPDFVGGFPDTLAVDADASLRDDCLGERAALHQPDEEQETVDSHLFLSLANSAKA
jgi:hypothetical protein